MQKRVLYLTYKRFKKLIWDILQAVVSDRNENWIGIMEIITQDPDLKFMDYKEVMIRLKMLMIIEIINPQSYPLLTLKKTQLSNNEHLSIR